MVYCLVVRQSHHQTCIFLFESNLFWWFFFFFANEHKKGNDGIKCKLTAFINKLFTFNISSPQTAWSMRTQLKVNICINKWLFATTKSLTYSDAHIKNFRWQSNRLVQTAYPRATQLVHPYMHDHTAHFSWNMLLHWEQRHNETISVCIFEDVVSSFLSSSCISFSCNT